MLSYRSLPLVCVAIRCCLQNLVFGVSGPHRLQSKVLAMGHAEIDTQNQL